MLGCWRCVPDGALPLAGWCVGGSTGCSHVGVFAWGLLPTARGCLGGLVSWWFGDWRVGVLVLFHDGGPPPWWVGGLVCWWFGGAPPCRCMCMGLMPQQWFDVLVVWCVGGVVVGG